MYILHRRAYPSDIIVGWYATSSELNNLSGLLHDFLCNNLDGLCTQPPIHMTVPTYDLLNEKPKSKKEEEEEENSNNKKKLSTPDIKVNTFVASAVGYNANKAKGSLFFSPIPNEVKISSVERPGIEALARARNTPSHSFDLVSDSVQLEVTLTKVLEMIDRVSAYVNSIIEKSTESESSIPATAITIGKYLSKNLDLVPSISKENLEKLFNSHLQDVLMVVYLANTVKTQLQLSSRLTQIV